MFETKFSRKVVAIVGAVVFGSACFVAPAVATYAVVILALWGAADLFQNVVTPWIDAGDDDDAIGA